MKKYIIGALVGSALTVSATAGATAVKQYMLTEVAYPIVVNGKEFKDTAAPILNYEGSTYVPLAKLGDITGVNYKWNEAEKRVEIVTSGTTATRFTEELLPGKSTSLNNAYSKGMAEIADRAHIQKMLEESAKVTVKSEFVVDQGNKVFHAYDVNGKFMGRFTDNDDMIYSMYRSQQIISTEVAGGSGLVDHEAPPKFSDGWVSDILMKRMFKYTINVENQTLTIKSAEGKELTRMTWPTELSSKKFGDVTIGNLKIKKYNTYTYFNVADLQKAGIIK